jgi:tRNA pseudouridine38-40 synthase
MPTLKLTLAYDGAAYVGWQRQANGPSVQACLELALKAFDPLPVTVVGAGRTDAGVHALAQVASVRLAHPIAPAALMRAANGRLPADIRVLSVELVPDDFHARFCATAKTYRYRLLGGPVVSPFERRYGWHVPRQLDFASMVAAGRLLIGEHDFAAFQASGSDVRTTRRTLFQVRVSPPTAGPWAGAEGDGETVATIDVRGSGFLRHMVRIVVGTLVEVGLGKRDHASVSRALQLATRDAAGQTAPPRGLFLVRVEYPGHAPETELPEATACA